MEGSPQSCRCTPTGPAGPRQPVTTLRQHSEPTGTARAASHRASQPHGLPPRSLRKPSQVSRKPPANVLPSNIPPQATQNTDPPNSTTDRLNARVLGKVKFDRMGDPDQRAHVTQKPNAAPAAGQKSDGPPPTKAGTSPPPALGWQPRLTPSAQARQTGRWGARTQPLIPSPRWVALGIVLSNLCIP